MPPARRIKVFGLLVLIFVVSVLFYTSALRQQQRSQANGALTDFYSKTVNGLDKSKKTGTGATAGTGASDDDQDVAKAMAERLKDAARVAKDNANAKAPKPDAPSEVVGVGNAAGDGSRSVAGRKKIPPGDAQEPLRAETQEEHEVEEELNAILKKSPIIIFSKSYCPYSKKAKAILLDKYNIDPTPYVVELDQHKLGKQLQAKLAELTGRKTVPNVLINGVSIGGGDDIAELDQSKKLIGKIKALGTKKVNAEERVSKSRSSL